jgi:ribonucleoside-diphosphate reductase alpha chain
MTNTIKISASMPPFTRTFSHEGVNVFDTVEWERRTVEILDGTGKAVFRQENVEVPKDWSQLAAKVVASKYFYGEQGEEERETSVRQLVSRVCGVITGWAVKDGYVTEQDGPVLYDELCYMCLHQIMAFNSPVWFNVGLWHVNNVKKSGTSHNWRYNKDTETPVKSQFQYEFPQCSACFIQSVEDNMESIMALATHEAMLFKFGSGTGTNLSTIRSSREVLSGGGRPSGPLSFLRIYDQVANVVKSGGRSRRAAKLNILNHDHGDFEEFIVAKQIEEKKAWALIEQGYDGSLNGDAYSTVAYQNENLSVRLSDDFMTKATTSAGDPHYWTKKVTTGEPLEKKNAKDMLKKIAEGAWICGDPGVQFDDTINKWHTCPASGRISAANPCSEFNFLDDTACNLASINLMKFVDKEKVFDADRFQAAVRTTILAQEVLVDNSSYPTAQICQNSHAFRPLGLGFCNLGALLMYFGYPYSSEEGRGLAAAITALMTGTAYHQSALIAGNKGAFEGYSKNKHHVGKVMMSHFDALDKIDCPPQFGHVCQRAGEAWRLVLDLESQVGLRNSQATVLAPTGTISFMMDCDTTGIEPDLSLVKYKALVGGGNLKIVNATVPMALIRLGYRDEEADRIVQHIAKWDTIEDVSSSDGQDVVPSGLKPEHLQVFDCAIATGNCKRSIPYMAHIQMMAAVQPFLSGGISKTVNVPNSATVDDISDIYVKAWQLGLKCVAVYRDGSKKGQPLKSGKGSQSAQRQIVQPIRRRMPDTRSAVTHKFSIAGHEGYLTVGFWDDDGAGELFIQMAKEGSTIGGLMDTIGTLVSIALQYGVPLDTLVEKFTHQRFEPSGFTTNPEIKTASSVIDYVFRWMQILSKSKVKVKPVEVLSKQAKETKPSAPATDAPSCHRCGHISVRNGSCHKCPNCGESLGCS